MNLPLLGRKAVHKQVVKKDIRNVIFNMIYYYYYAFH